MSELARCYGKPLTAAIVALSAFWLAATVILPNLILLQFSFRPYLPVDQLGGPNDVYMLANDATVFSSPIHMQVFLALVMVIITILGAVLYEIRRRRTALPEPAPAEAEDDVAAMVPIGLPQALSVG